MARFTGKRLENEVDEMNEGLAEAGALIRFRYAPRNQYQAVDEYEVDPDGNRPDTCCRNVGCGTPREVSQWTWERYYQILNQLESDRKDAEIARLKAENERLKRGE